MLIGLAAMVAGAQVLAQPATAPARPMQLDAAWLEAPRSRLAEGLESPGVKAVLIDGPAWRGKPTTIFAWYGVPELRPGEKAPGMVLVHGGGGTAFAEWVRLWTSRGYAAIAMDTCGQVPRGSYGKWERNENGGPPGWGGFGMVDEPMADQWTYHAVASVVLSHSFLRSLPEVDAERVGLTGISWGGYLTCVVAGLDTRVRFAVPVYGCGFLGDNSVWLPDLKAMGSDRAGRWLAMWDPSVYLRNSSVPMLWVTGTNDFAYPMDSLQKSYRLPKSPHTLAVRIRMPHGHGGAGENPEEIHAVANHLLRGGKPLARITAQGQDGETAWTTFAAEVPVKRAELCFTRDTGQWQDRTWESVPAMVGNGRASATIPAGTTVYYLNLIDERGLLVSSEHLGLAAR